MRVRWYVGIPWWIALWVWLLWFTVTILLTFVGLCVIAGGGVLWLAGRAARKPGLEQTGAGIALAAMAISDAVNDHGDKWRSP